MTLIKYFLTLYEHCFIDDTELMYIIFLMNDTTGAFRNHSGQFGRVKLRPSVINRAHDIIHAYFMWGICNPILLRTFNCEFYMSALYHRLFDKRREIEELFEKK